MSITLSKSFSALPHTLYSALSQLSRTHSLLCSALLWHTLSLLCTALTHSLLCSAVSLHGALSALMHTHTLCSALHCTTLTHSLSALLWHTLSMYCSALSLLSLTHAHTLCSALHSSDTLSALLCSFSALLCSALLWHTLFSALSLHCTALLWHTLCSALHCSETLSALLRTALTHSLLSLSSHAHTLCSALLLLLLFLLLLCDTYTKIKKESIFFSQTDFVIYFSIILQDILDKENILFVE